MAADFRSKRTGIYITGHPWACSGLSTGFRGLQTDALTMNGKVEEYFEGLEKWRDELVGLRRIVTGCGLVEELKWGAPCYSFEGRNVVILGGLKGACVMSFLKGTLLADLKGILRKPGENSQAARVVKFTSIREILGMEGDLKAYVYEAMEIEKAGLKVAFKDPADFILVDELQEKLENDPKLKAAFEALTPGRRRAYNMHFSSAKQSATRVSRIEKYVARILCGKGLNDCTCGFSKRMPACDGSHKFAV